jgi:raffinose/stachyose/melibiose transport system substrate-binding protein
MTGRRVPTAAAALLALITALLAGCTAKAPEQPGAKGSAADDPEHASLTYWYWGESDAPGANDWMKARVAEYHTAHPGVTIKLVPQSTDTLIGAFATAAQTKSGPDIATQWATIPVLSQAWSGAITAISDLVPDDQRKNWIGVQENTDRGKLWGVPLYVIGIPLAYNKTLFTRAGLSKPPATFDELLSACAALKRVGITPIGGGNKDGYFGAWFFSNFGKQQLDDTGALKQAITGEQDIAGPKFMGFYGALETLQKNGCFNDDIASLTLDQGMSKFASGKAAMAWGTDGIVNSWAVKLGANTVGVARTPVWGKGKLATVHNTTQSSTAFITSWSKHPRAAAQFLTWLHEPANLASWYTATGIFPADSRFSSSSLTSDLAKTLWEFDSSPGAVWLENYLPPQVDGDGDLAGGQKVTSGGSAADAAATFTAAVTKWRKQGTREVQDYTTWAKGS